MTQLRFFGDLPLWLGLALSVLVAVMAWRYYRRESDNLTRRLRWLLPALRASAFFLGVMILTGPVLHHRQTIGELGRVKIYVDSSQSMGMLDRHLPTSRKLLIAEQQGWLAEGRIDSQLYNHALMLQSTRIRVICNVQQEEATAAGVLSNRDQLQATVESAIKAAEAASDYAVNKLATAIADLSAIASQLQSITASDNVSATTAAAMLIAQCQKLEAVEQQMFEAFEADVQRLMDGNDQSVLAALAIFDETPRWRRAERGLLENEGSLFEQLRQHHSVEVLALDNELAVEMLDGLALEDSPTQFDQTADAATTDLISGILATQTSSMLSQGQESSDTETQPSQPNAAIVLLTDGQHNSGPSPLQSARVLGSQGVAFYPVAIGATQTAPDMAVIDLQNPQLVFSKDRVRGTMTIRDHMPAGQAITAKIVHTDEVVWQKQLLTQGTGDRRIDFEFGIEDLVAKLGEQFDSAVQQHTVPVSMTASISVLPQEAEVKNNAMPLQFAAVVQSYRLLIIDGRSRWETRYLRNAFDRDSQWQVNAVIAGPGTDDIVLPRGDGNGLFPGSRNELFKYDLIVFGEVVPELLADYEYTWIKEFIELSGGGIVFIDGQRGRLKNFTDDNLAALLPVEWQSTQTTSLPTMLQLTDIGSRLAAFKFEADQQSNSQFWNELPAPHRINAVTAVPGSEVLVEAMVDGTTLPLVVTRNYGSGRVLYLASDETWRWRYKAADIYHQRIWNQLAQYVMPRPFTASDEYLAIDTGSVSYDHFEEAPIRIRLTGLDGKPSTGTTVDALLWKQGQIDSMVSLTEDPQVPGLYRGKSAALSDGDYEVSIRASGFSQEALKAKGRFVVRPAETTELQNTTCNEELLQQMAAASGGAYLREEQLDQLSDLLRPLSSGRIIESDTVLWQSYWWFSVILILLTLEWFLRKRAGLL